MKPWSNNLTETIVELLPAAKPSANFMNLATARSEQRAKEVGVLKVMGARKKD